MDSNALSDVINQAAVSHQWLLLGLAGLALLVPIVLHALGNDIPFVSSILNALVEVVKGMKTVDPVPKDAPQGIAKIVPIVNATKPAAPVDASKDVKK